MRDYLDSAEKVQSNFRNDESQLESTSRNSIILF